MHNKRRSSSSSCSSSCKKHPKHRQSPGVCSLCLRERLSKISRRSSRVTTNVSSCSSSSVSSVSSSNSSNALSNKESPMHGSFLKNNLNKSKSMAFVSEKMVEDAGVKKKGGFWSKLMHSRTMREMLTTRV